MKKKITLIIILAAAAGALFLWQQQRGSAAPENLLEVFGNVDIREARLSFNGSEHIGELLVDEGDRVHKDQVLARLHTERLIAARDQARARVEAQRQVVARLHAGTRPEEIRAARARLTAAKARAVAAEKTFKRLASLAERKLVSPEERDEAEAAFRAARAQVKAEQAALDLALAGPRVEDIAAAEAELQAQQAALALADQALRDAELLAPADGIIRERILETGDMVTPQTPVFTLALTDPVWVRAYLPETLLGRVRPGMRAEILTDSYPDKVYAGWVGYISPTAEFTPKNVETPELRTRLVYRMRVFACNPAGELRLGMPATVRLDLEASADEPVPTSDICQQAPP